MIQDDGRMHGGDWRRRYAHLHRRWSRFRRAARPDERPYVHSAIDTQMQHAEVSYKYSTREN